MVTEDFEKYSKQMLEQCWKVLHSKSDEYSTAEDKLANFKQPCTMMQSNPAETCLWYDMKHVASLVKMAKDVNKGKLPTQAMLMEKVGDYINYGLLFYGIVMELITEEAHKEMQAAYDGPIELYD